MAKDLELVINIDGAARGNPGPAAYGFVIHHDGEVVLEENGVLGEATNNVAEYTALLHALAKASELRATDVLVRSDSELLVKQMNGQYRVKNEALRDLFKQAEQLRGRFKAVRFSHVPREENREADRLCNEALDGRGASGHRLSAASHRPELKRAEGTHAGRKPLVEGRKPAADWTATLADAERILREAAVTWSEAGLDDPTPHQILQKIARVFQDRGFLKH